MKHPMHHAPYKGRLICYTVITFHFVYSIRRDVVALIERMSVLDMCADHRGLIAWCMMPRSVGMDGHRRATVAKMIIQHVCDM